MLGVMVSAPGNVSPGPGYFQAVQGLVRPEDSAGANTAAKPVAQPDAPRAARSVEAAPKADPGSSGRDFPRGSFIDIRA